MLKVIEFIKSHSNWRDILTNTPYCLRIIDEGEFTILKFTYNGSDFNNDIVRECRGIIIDSNLNPVCIPFFKFFNYGEPYADEIDWESAVVEEKIDGMLIKVWNYSGTWMVSTKDTILAEKVTISANNDNDSAFKSYSGLFLAALKEIKFDITSLNPQYTYVFELVSPYTRLVVPYESIDVYHIGTRDNISGQELEIDIEIKKPKTYKCNNITDLTEMASKLPYSDEGYVVKDKNYKRIKVKSPSYIAVKHYVGRMKEENMIDIIRKDEATELFAYFPEYKDKFDNMIRRINSMLSDMNNMLQNEYNPNNFASKDDYLTATSTTLFPEFFIQKIEISDIRPSEWLWSLPSKRIAELINQDSIQKFTYKQGTCGHG